MARTAALLKDTDRAAQGSTADGAPIGLRERQKRKRRSQILEGARTLFNAEGYEETTIDDVAAWAEVSAATVHNYYGTKARILIELVDRCDDEIRLEIDRIATGIDGTADIKAVLNDVLARITTGSLRHLEHHVWRHAIATSITREDLEFGIGFSQAHTKFIQSIGQVVRQLEDRGLLPRAVDPEICASVLYKIHHALFIELIVEQKPNLAKYRTAQRAHVDLLLDGICGSAARKPTRPRGAKAVSRKR